MKRISFAALAIIAAFTSHDWCYAQTAAAPAAAFEQRVQVDATRKKSTRIGGGDFDDKTDRITFTVKLTNTDTRTAFEGCKAEFHVFAQSIVNTKAYQLLGTEQFDFSLPPRGVHSVDTQEVTTRWDRTGIRHGTKYDSWVLVVRDSTDKVVLKKASVPTWLPVAEQMKELPTRPVL